MDPFANGYPYHLSKLTKIEEMLIARNYPVMWTYHLQGETVRYNGNVLNIKKEIQGLVSSLPAVSWPHHPALTSQPHLLTYT
eukprot:4726236-Ditylum_brightwellii.AAC.1